MTKKVKVTQNGQSRCALLARRLLGAFLYPFPISLCLFSAQKLVKTLTFICMFLLFFRFGVASIFHIKGLRKLAKNHWTLTVYFTAFNFTLWYWIKKQFYLWTYTSCDTVLSWLIKIHKIVIGVEGAQIVASEWLEREQKGGYEFRSIRLLKYPTP